MVDLKVEFCGCKYNNPILTASGTFSAVDSGEFYDINELGGCVTKGVANNPWKGNDTPRIAESYGGMLNAVGLQNPGVDKFIEDELTYLKKFNTRKIINICL